MILISPSASHQTAIFRLKAQLIKPKSYQALVPSPEKNVLVMQSTKAACDGCDA